MTTYISGCLRYNYYCCSVAQSCPTLCLPKDCSTPGFLVLHHLPEFVQSHVHWIGAAVQPSHPLSSLLPLPSIFLSIRVFSNESPLHIRWPKHWSFSFIISPSNEYSGLISFRIDWFYLLEVQGTLKSLLQYDFESIHSWVLSHSYVTTGKTIALTRRTFVSKVTYLLFNRLSRLLIAFLPRSKHFLISWLQSSSTIQQFWSPRK